MSDVSSLSKAPIEKQIEGMRISREPDDGSKPSSIFEQHPIAPLAEGTVAKPADGEIKETEKSLVSREIKEQKEAKFEDFLAAIHSKEDELMAKMAKLQEALAAEKAKAAQAEAECVQASAAFQKWQEEFEANRRSLPLHLMKKS